MTEDLRDLAAKVRQRAVELLGVDSPVVLDHDFVKECLDANERGDGVMYATLNKDFFRYNTTPKEGEWLVWGGNVWNVDTTRRSLAAVEKCALQYQVSSDEIKADIERNGVDKNSDDSWKINLKEKYDKRVQRLRTEYGVKKTLFWAPIVHEATSVRENDFNKHPMLLPCRNGVIDLKTGVLTQGRQEDMLTLAINIDYDPHADYADFQNFIDEVTDDPEVSNFIKRSLGYAITGHAYEQFIWVFIGPGRNGKGVLFNLLSELMGPYYHEISRAMILEQRNEPTPGASSEHLYSLLGKRIIVGAETNKNQKIDGGSVKTLTGTNDIKCRPNFRSELVFPPTHSLFLQTNNMPTGMTKEFPLLQRLRIIKFPFMFVDDIEAEQKKYPGKAHLFRKKNPVIIDKLRKCLPGFLRWLVEGCLEWQKIGLDPPKSIIDGVEMMAKAEDYVGQFYADCLEYYPDDAGPMDSMTKNRIRIPCTAMFDAFRWWWSVNNDSREQRTPGMKSINLAIRDMGFSVEKKAGKTWIYNHTINMEICDDVENYVRTHAKS